MKGWYGRVSEITSLSSHGPFSPPPPAFSQGSCSDGESLAPGFDLNQGLKQDGSTRGFQEHSWEHGECPCVRVKISWNCTAEVVWAPSITWDEMMWPVKELEFSSNISLKNHMLLKCILMLHLSILGSL